MKNKKGFTLIELLAVIVILAVIALIAVPLIMNVIDKAKRGAFEDTAYGIVSAAEHYYANEILDGNEMLGKTFAYPNDTELKYKGTKPKGGKVSINAEGQVQLAIHDGTYCVTKAFDATKVVVSDDIENCVVVDTTPPSAAILQVTKKTSNSITVKGIGVDLDSDITKYEFAIDTGDYIDKGLTDTHTFTNVTNTENHTIKLRVTNGVGLTKETSMIVKPNDIVEPTYSVTPTGLSESKTVTITYPERQEGYIYSYSIDGGTTWTIVESGTTKDIVFNKLGTVIARIFDGTNYKIASTFTVTGIILPDIQIAFSGHFTMFLMPDGTVKVVGNNSEGQLGLGHTNNVTSITTIPNLNNVKQIAAGSLHSIFVMKDGTVKLAGINADGQLGDGSKTRQRTPITLGITGVKQASGGVWHTLFLMNDGTVRATGRNNEGQLGDGSTAEYSNFKYSSILIPNLSGVKQVSAAGYFSSIFVMEDGTVKTTGSSTYGSSRVPTLVSRLSNVKQAANSSDYPAFLMNDGTVEVNKNIIAGLTGVKQVVAGAAHAVFLMEDGTVKAIGKNNYGQLGDGTTTDRNEVITIPNLSGVKAVFAGGSNTGFLMEDGTVKLVGLNNYGQLGDGTTNNATTPIDVQL